MRKRLVALFVAVCVVASLQAEAALAATFSNPGPITITDSPNSCTNSTDATQEPATPYPSQIQVSGLSTPVSDVNATITGFAHTFPADVRMLLVGPHGQSTDLLDEVGAGDDTSDVTLTFDDAATMTVPTPIVSGTFKPTQEAQGCGQTATDAYPSPAPASPYGTNLAGFNGTDPNGTWSLYVVDNNHEDSGTISGGWSLEIATPASPASPASPKGEDPKCKRLRKKLKRQKRGLAKAGSDSKAAMIEANITDTKQRLRKLGCM